MSSIVRVEAKSFASSLDEFCWKYFSTLKKDENIFFSPYGINAALSILSNGASGETQKEFLSALNVDNLRVLNKNHQEFSKVVQDRHRDQNLFMESNLLLIDKKIFNNGLNKNFKKVVSNIYDSEVRSADFEKNLFEVKNEISNWVREKTYNFIPDYSSIANESTLADILNVVYFKAAWEKPFNPQNTTRELFKNVDGSTEEVSMMYRTFNREISYFEDDKYKGIELFYKADSNGERTTAMYLILPVNDESLNIAEEWNREDISYRESFIDKLWSGWEFDGFVIVSFPKFELDVENNLVESFKEIGIKKAFTSSAEFYNMINDTTLVIDNANHRAKIKVDEAGTESSAATEITLIRGAAPVRSAIFCVNRPFLFLIKDFKTGATLFTGVVNKF